MFCFVSFTVLDNNEDYKYILIKKSGHAIGTPKGIIALSPLPTSFTTMPCMQRHASAVLTKKPSGECFAAPGILSARRITPCYQRRM
jgi:hypothetical protein